MKESIKAKVLSATAVVLLVPATAHASDMGSLILLFFIPALIVGIIAALVLRWLMNKDPEKCWPGYLLLGLFCVISIPAAFCAYVAATYLGSPYWGDAVGYFVVFAFYCLANFFALRTYFKNRKPDEGPAPAPPPAKVVRRFVLIWAGIALAVLGWFFGQAAYQDYKVDQANKAWRVKKLNTIMLYGSAAFTPDGRCRTVHNPQAEADEERRLYSARLSAEEDGKEKLLAEVKKLKLKKGGTVGEAASADPALAERLQTAVSNSEMLSDADCAVWRSTCSLKMGFPKPALSGLGLDIIDPGQQNYSETGYPTNH